MSNLELRRDLILSALSDPYLELNTVEVAELISELAEIDTELSKVSDEQDARNSRPYPY